MKNVLVTGANGHVGFMLVKALKEKGYRVRGTVRNLADAAKSRHLSDLNIELVEADLMQPESLKPAMLGMDGLFQVAAVYKTMAADPQKEIIDPSVTGGLNALKAAHEAGVKKVVFTSSVAAIGSDAPPEKPLTENDWNDGAVNPYFIAKTQAEKKAWEFSKTSGLKLVVINPVAIIGPGFYRHTPSTVAFEQVIRGQMPLCLPMGYSLVDVRDVVAAHIMAYENEQASGRYLVTDQYFEMIELLKRLKNIDPSLKIPSIVLPQFMLGMVPLMDWLNSKFTGAARQASRDMVQEMGGRSQRASSEKIRKELGWTTIPTDQSLKDTLEWTRQTFVK